MIRHLPLRLATAVLAPMLLLHPHAAHCAPAASRAPIQMPHISVQVIGHGKPVILIPGLASPRAVWDAVVPALTRTHTVYLVQVNGFAGDDPVANVQPGILDGVVADIDALVAKERIAGAAVVGHSLGGLVGLKLARAHPADVGRLMVVDALPFIGAMFGPGLTPAMLEPRAKAMRDTIVASYGKPADAGAVEATANRLALKPESRTKVAGWARAADPRVTGQAMYEDLTTDVRPDLSALSMPVTLVVPWNADLPQAKVDALYRGEYAAVTHMTFVDVADSAHFVMLDQPEAFARALDGFLAG